MNKRITYNQNVLTHIQKEWANLRSHRLWKWLSPPSPPGTREVSTSWLSGCCQAQEGLRSRTQRVMPGSLTAGHRQRLTCCLSLNLNEECNLRLDFSLLHQDLWQAPADTTAYSWQIPEADLNSLVTYVIYLHICFCGTQLISLIYIRGECAYQ